ncbi:uncharacterized protein AMSG_11293 [Thecamonas trahens ATCC 50062]|uniref:TATA-binding protein interacting (TIP20) domain-containing protein n=1 Tax=Thecamonas trahens ATCC 50062 TaxID=461836 RepID=A0A0L0DU44_THETB|nr:hypothetical protein AMSG_11293 [Thecamonas trahens ATCC 50062]KNC55849.1 hypothetical protein AMSG_11293 [Thecamonas trahens ATCC 50062]|eukprot:XP_013752775.1 hypothetical protein AMSG_11293 [Thecamonas trahens ATCC 50062]
MPHPVSASTSASTSAEPAAVVAGPIRELDTAALALKALVENIVAALDAEHAAAAAAAVAAAASASASATSGSDAQAGVSDAMLGRAHFTAAHVLEPLTSGLEKAAALSDNHLLRCLEVLSVFTGSAWFSSIVLDSQNAIVDTVRALFSHSRATARKLAIGCYVAVAHFARSEGEDELVAELVADIVSWLETHAAEWRQDAASPAANATLRTYVLALSSLVAAVPSAFTPHLATVLDTLTLVIADPADREHVSDSVVELSEAVLLALRAVVLALSTSLPPRLLDAIKGLATSAVTFDPNFQGSSPATDAAGPADESMAVSEGSDNDDDDDLLFDSEFEDSDEGFTDDDEDISWKVRRAGWQLLTAIISSTPGVVATLFETSLSLFVARFDEREPTVQTHAFETFVALLEQTYAFADVNDHALAILRDSLPSVVASLARVADARVESSRVGAINVFLALLKLVGVAGLAPDYPQWHRVFRAGLAASRKYTDDVRIATLAGIRAFFTALPSSLAQLGSLPAVQVVTELVPDVVALATLDCDYRLTVAALHGLASLFPHLEGCMTRDEIAGEAFTTLVSPVFAALDALLSAANVYTDVRKVVLSAFAELVVSACAVAVPPRLVTAMDPLFVAFAAKLDSDVIRSASVAALCRMCEAAVPPPSLVAHLPTVLAKLCDFLVLASRPLKQHALLAIRLVVTSYASALETAALSADTQTLVATILKRIGASLLSPRDVLLATTAIETALALAPFVGPASFRRTTEADVLKLATAPTTTGAVDECGDAILAYYSFLVSSGAMSLDDLTAALIGLATTLTCLDDLPRSAFVIFGRILGRAASSNPDVSATAAATAHLAVVRQYGLCIQAATAAKAKLAAKRAKLAAKVEASEGAVAAEAEASSSSRSGSGASASASANAAAHRATLKKTEDQLAAVLAEIDALREAEPADIGGALVATYALGELAARDDLTSVEGLFDAVVVLLSSLDDQIRSAGAFALGRALLGAPSTFLPQVLDVLASANASSLYFIVQAFDHMFTAAQASGVALVSMSDLQPALETMQTGLFAAAAELPAGDGTRNLIARVLGLLARGALDCQLGILAGKLQHVDEAPSEAETALVALRTALAPPLVVATALACVDRILPLLLPLLGHTELDVRAAAVGTVAFVAKFYARALAAPAAPDAGLDHALPLLYALVEPNPDLVETVNRGPFKQKIDHGASVRAAALDCMAIILSKLPDRLDMAEFVRTVVSVGMADTQHPVKLLAHRTLVHMVALLPIPLAQWTEAIIDALRKSLDARPKVTHQLAIQQHTELVESALKVVAAISASPHLASPRWNAWVASEVTTGQHADTYARLVAASAKDAARS